MAHKVGKVHSTALITLQCVEFLTICIAIGNFNRGIKVYLPVQISGEV